MATLLQQQPPELSLARNPIEFQLLNIEQWGSLAYLVAHLYIETEASSGTYEKIEEFEAARDEYGNATFDISQTILAHLEYYWRRDHSLNFLRSPHLSKRYYIAYGCRTGPEILFATVTGTGTFADLPRHLRPGKVYHLLIDTQEPAIAGTVHFRHTDYNGQQTVHYPAELTAYEGKIYARFTPPPPSWDFVELDFQQISAPLGLQVQIFTDYAMLTKSEEKFALLGAWHHTQFPGRTTLLPQGKKLLSTGPANQHVVEGQLQHLYYLPPVSENTVLTVRVKWRHGLVSYTDYDRGLLQQYIAYRFGLQLANNRLPGYEPGFEFELVELELNGELLKTYTRREPASDYLQEVYYTNDLGGIETLLCQGKGSRELHVEQAVAERYLEPLYQADQATTITYHSEGRQRQRFATGPLTEAEFNQHLGLFLAREIRVKVDGQQLPATLLSKKVTRSEDGNPLMAFEFELEYAYPFNAMPVESTQAHDLIDEQGLLILNEKFLKITD